MNAEKAAPVVAFVMMKMPVTGELIQIVYIKMKTITAAESAQQLAHSERTQALEAKATADSERAQAESERDAARPCRNARCGAKSGANRRVDLPSQDENVDLGGSPTGVLTLEPNRE